MAGSVIATVIFDLGGVYFTDGTTRAIEQISATCGIPEESVRHVLMGNLGTRYRVSEIGSGEFWEGAKNHWACRSQTRSSLLHGTGLSWQLRQLNGGHA